MILTSNNKDNIMQKKYSFFLLCLIMVIAACKKEKALDTGIVQYGQLYKYENTTLGLRLQTIYEKTGSYILYQNIGVKDYTWNFDRSLGNNWRANGVSNAETNMPIILDYLNEYWFALYSEQFLRNYLPLRIILSDSLLNGTQRLQYQKGEGMQAIGIRLVNTATTPVTTHIAAWTEAQKKTISKNLHQNFYLETIANKLSTELPESFFAGSSYDYSVDNASPAKKNPKELGFWNFGVNGANAISPTKAVDVMDYLKNIAATRPENMQSLFSYTVGTTTFVSELMKEKYRILQEYIQAKYSMNFHILNRVYL